VQARWFFQAMGRPPIPDAAIRAHFAPAFLAQNPPAFINAKLAGAGQLRLVSVAPKRPDLVEFVVSVRGAQRFRIALPVDAHGRIASIQAQELAPIASPASVLPALAPGWVAQPVTFEAGGVTIYGTYTHPGSAAAGTIPAAVLLGGSGSTTDRNDNDPGQPDRNTLAAVANWLSADGVASLRYDKLGSGQTGWGKYAAHPGRAGIGPYEQEAVAALNFLARQRQINRARLAVFGHSQGGIYALLLASRLAGHAPKVRAVGLLEPVPIRFLDLLGQSTIASIASLAQQGQITAAQAQNLKQALARAIASLRRTGTLPARLPDGLPGTFSNNGTPLELAQIDRYDPAAGRRQVPSAHSGAAHLQQRRRQVRMRPGRPPRRRPVASPGEAGLRAPQRGRPLPQRRHHQEPGGIQPAASVLRPAARRAEDLPGQQPLKPPGNPIEV
jgi:predicted esterase